MSFFSAHLDASALDPALAIELHVAWYSERPLEGVVRIELGWNRRQELRVPPAVDARMALQEDERVALAGGRQLRIVADLSSAGAPYRLDVSLVQGDRRVTRSLDVPERDQRVDHTQVMVAEIWLGGPRERPAPPAPSPPPPSPARPPLADRSSPAEAAEPSYRAPPAYSLPDIDLPMPSAPPAPVGSPAPRKGGRYTVWYATNRKPTETRGERRGYSSERDAVVHYGSCTVDIPASHRIGSLGSPWWRRLFTRVDDRVTLRAVRETTAPAHWAAIAEQLRRVAEDERHGVVFVHGYNVSFEDAARRAAQIGHDLQIRGAMSFFSWPSRGTVEGYPADEATIEASEGSITDYLCDFARRSGASRVHVIAHSMGNRGVLRAVNRIVADAALRSDTRFEQFILAAPDVDADVFRELCVAFRRVAARTTLYVSERDRAVAMSRFLHDAPRVGFSPPVTVVDGIDTVSVQNVDLTLLGHGYVGEAREVLGDMHQLIFFGAPPERRMGLRETRTGGGRFWTIGA